MRIAAPLHKLLKRLAVENEVTLDALVQDALALAILRTSGTGLGAGAHFAQLRAVMVEIHSKKQAPKA